MIILLAKKRIKKSVLKYIVRKTLREWQDGTVRTINKWQNQRMFEKRTKSYSKRSIENSLAIFKLFPTHFKC